MKRSSERILTTHTGSLPRPDDLLALLQDREQGKLADQKGLQSRTRTAVVDVVRTQIEAGIDIVNDGEQGKCDYSTYIKDRLTGFTGTTTTPLPTREAKEFPEFAARRGDGGFRQKSLNLKCGHRAERARRLARLVEYFHAVDSRDDH